jgi:hypothetical protein
VRLVTAGGAVPNTVAQDECPTHHIRAFLKDEPTEVRFSKRFLELTRAHAPSWPLNCIGIARAEVLSITKPASVKHDAEFLIRLYPQEISS